MLKFSWNFKLNPIKYVINFKQIIHAPVTREWNKRLHWFLKIGIFPLRVLYPFPIASTQTTLSLLQLRVKLNQMKERMTQSLNLHLPVVTTKVLTQLWWVSLQPFWHQKLLCALWTNFCPFRCSALQDGSLLSYTIGIQQSSHGDYVIKYTQEFCITV